MSVMQIPNSVNEKDVEYENTQEKDMLRQFRKNLSDVLKPTDTDSELLKWLRAKNFNLQKSEIIFREKNWTNELYQLHNLDEAWEMPEVTHKYGFDGYIGIAKDGTPVRYMCMGRADLKGFVHSMDTFNISTYGAYCVEKDLKTCREQSIKLGRDINQITYVVDMEGFHLGQLLFAGVLELSLDLFRMIQDGYPEVWKNVLIVNAPSTFSIVFSILRPVLRHILLKDFQVISKQQTANLLLKYIDEDVLPAFLGGKRVDSQGNPMCKEFIQFGGLIPEEYYLRNHPPLQPTDVGAQLVWIYPRCCYNHSIVIRQATALLHLEYRTEGGSQFQGILFRKLGSDPANPDLPSTSEYLDESDPRCNVVAVSPYAHALSHIAAVNTKIFIPRPGIYIMKFDNTANWVSSRKLIFRCRLLEPQDVCPS